MKTIAIEQITISAETALLQEIKEFAEWTSENCPNGMRIFKNQLDEVMTGFMGSDLCSAMLEQERGDMYWQWSRLMKLLDCIDDYSKGIEIVRIVKVCEHD